ncbi:MAG: DUF2807 domain-containing protein [Sphingobacteriales bacterium]|nr:MAG: DUF2807 domain-containing protein [Sphingobacteriales bacterium]
MCSFTRFLSVALLVLVTGNGYSQTINTRSFDKVIISPFIEATFIEGDQEQVVINSCIVDPKKLHVETKNGTLRVYLEGAKEIPRESRENRNSNRDLYPKHAVNATIYYKKLDALSLRGEESFTFPRKLSAERFTLTLYGESIITFADVHINELRATLYGEGSLEIQSGLVNTQIYTSYGEGKVTTTGIASNEAKLKAYGEAEFNVNVSERIKITSFGEAKLRYKGNPEIVKGLHVGGVDVARLD